MVEGDRDLAKAKKESESMAREIETLLRQRKSRKAWPRRMKG